MTLRWTLFFLIYKMRKGIEKKYLILHGWENREQNIEEYENENYYLLRWSDKRHFPYDCLGLSDEDNSVSRTDNFVNAIVFNSVTYIFSCTHLPEIETLQERKN